MLIEHKEADGKGMFYIKVDGHIQAEMTYTKPAADKLIIDHTEVDPKLSGKGIGLQLLSTLVEFARTENLKVIPLCPFAKSVFDKKKEFRDVLL